MAGLGGMGSGIRWTPAAAQIASTMRGVGREAPTRSAMRCAIPGVNGVRKESSSLPTER